MKVTLNKKLKPFATQQARYKIAYGGRGSSKSWTIARILLLKAMQKPMRILCTREIQDSIKDSVHKLLKDQIDLLELQGYIVQNDVIRHANGSEFLFKGLYTNLSKIKSFEGVDICWIEEAESISAMSWEILDPTIRKPDSEIWISFNPRYEHDIIYTTFIENPPDNAIVIKVNWQDNKYFPKELEDQKNRMMKNDPDKYLHIWEGQLKKNTDEQVLNNKWCIEDFNTPDNVHFYFGADWGFSNDPNTLTRCFIAPHKDYGNNCLYIDYEANDRPYNSENRITSSDIDALPALWDTVPLVRQHQVKADNARPETIAHMVKNGFNVVPSQKGKGSVEDGVSYLRSFDKIIIHSRCLNTIHEAKYYSYKVDKASGQVTSIILDKYNHMIDALRYSLEDARNNSDKWW
jgi:phage terminase large subunit